MIASVRRYLLFIAFCYYPKGLSFAADIPTFQSQEQPLVITIIPPRAAVWKGPDKQTLSSVDHASNKQRLLASDQTLEQTSDPGLIVPPTIRGQENRFTKVMAEGSILYDGSYRLGESSANLKAFFPVQNLYTGVSPYDIAQTSPVAVITMEDNLLSMPDHYTLRVNSIWGEQLTVSGSENLDSGWKLKLFGSRSISNRDIEWWNNRGTPLLPEDDGTQTLKHFSSQSTEVGLGLTRKSGPIRFGLYRYVALREGAIPNPSYETHWPESSGHASQLYSLKRLSSTKHNTILSLKYALNKQSCYWIPTERIERCDETLGLDAQSTSYMKTIKNAKGRLEEDESVSFSRVSIFIKQKPSKNFYFLSRFSLLENIQAPRHPGDAPLGTAKELYAGVRYLQKSFFSDLGYRKTWTASNQSREKENKSFGYKLRLGIRGALFYAYIDKSKDLSAPEQNYVYGDESKGIDPNADLINESIDYSAISLGAEALSTSTYIQAYQYKNNDHVFLAPSSFGFSKAQQRDADINGILIGAETNPTSSINVTFQHAKNSSVVKDSHEFSLPGIPDYAGKLAASWTSKIGRLSGNISYTGRSYLDRLNLQQTLPTYSCNMAYSKTWNIKNGHEALTYLSVSNIFNRKYQEIEFSNNNQKKKGRLSYRQHGRIPELGRELELVIKITI